MTDKEAAEALPSPVDREAVQRMMRYELVKEFAVTMLEASHIPHGPMLSVIAQKAVRLADTVINLLEKENDDERG